MSRGNQPVLERDIHETRELRTAEELFRELSQGNGEMWRINGVLRRADWIFRGQANGEDGAIWSLLPSAHRRPDAFLSFMRSQVVAQQITGKELRELETGYVLNFAEVVDKHGYVVPSDSHELRDGRRKIKPPWDDPTLFPPPHLVSMFSLAQHHGVPTRLLDWTWKPLVAIYFAAEPVARRRAPGVKPPANEAPYFSIYALRRVAVEACLGLDPEIRVLSVPTATNANLHAQGGQFSLVQPLSDPGNAALPPVDQVLSMHAESVRARDDGGWCHLFPLLIEFRIPVEEARTVMLVLRQMGVSAASVYPGLDGVVKSMKEERFYQWASVSERS